MRFVLRASAALLFATMLAPAAQLTPAANSALQHYVAGVEARLARQHAKPSTCLAMVPQADPDGGADADRQLLGGAVWVEPVNGGSWEVNGALLHHWRAVAFVPGASPRQLSVLLSDSDDLSRYFAPEVVSSHSLGRDGEILMRFKKQLMITVVLDGEFKTESGFISGNCGYRFSRSTHIWQIDQPGSVHERRRAEGSDDGFLWRLNSYWSFRKWRDGLLIECEAVSLTRDIPAGLGWLITPVIETLPRNSLEFTLAATRNALLEKVKGRQIDARSN